MSGRGRIVLAGLLIGSLLVTALVLGLTAPWRDSEVTTESRTIQYTLAVRNTGGQVLRDSELHVFVPMNRTGIQQLQELRVDRPHSVAEDEHGNQMLQLGIGNVYPYEMQEVRVRAVLTVASLPARAGSGGAQFLAPDRFIESDDPRIKAVADRLRADSPRASAEAAYNWVRRHLTYSGYIEQDHGALWALLNRRGDCTEFAYLYAAVLRAQGIPAKVIGGFVTDRDGIVRGQAFHNWVEAYVDGRWRIVDPQRGSFMQNENNYIAMRVLTGGSKLSSQRFAYTQQALDVVMR